ncbi:MAG: hypothetical protein IPH78_14000 [Bacteroidetes bacterium]|nr:hypothetical protein [Bacteroidota bacterium]
MTKHRDYLANRKGNGAGGVSSSSFYQRPDWDNRFPGKTTIEIITLSVPLV